MKLPWTLTLLAMLVSITLMATEKERPFSNNINSNVIDSWSSYAEDDLESRVKSIDLPFTPRITGHVKSQIKHYVTNGYRDTERMLGRSLHYFPVFEHYLKKYNLPYELKYLPMVESRLNARAKSLVGASGLWQFIPATGRAYGLTINSTVDERLDPHKSSEAAAKMLSALYEEFQDWSLVLAAYNCGPARVKKAIRLGGCRNFWDINRYLPRETQKYVPRFIAAAYIANYYTYHQIDPVVPSAMKSDVRTFRVHNYMRFKDISYVSGVKISTLAYLNPGFLGGVIPKSKAGHLINLPASAAPAFREFLEERVAKASTSDMNYEVPEGTMKSLHKVRAGENLESLARLCKCNIKEIMLWNNLNDETIVVHQELVLYLPKEALFYRP
ncbi:MAG: transglycosylase SLT domain-containing protein [Bacteroidota bacterium]